MALVADYQSLQVIDAWQNLPAEGPFSGYRCIISSLGRVAQWNGSAWSITVLVDTVSPSGNGFQAVVQAPSVAADTAAMVVDFNLLLVKLKNAGLMAS
jgi:hypothetical protein